MRRQGNYSEYCGTKEQLPVFVTTNSRLIGIALKFRENRSKTTSLYGWKHNRLPVITDIRLTCRLWSPSDNGERMSMLYLTANTVAAKRPTKRYLNSIRDLAIQLSKQVPEYSEICLSEYFDDTVTDAVLEHTKGEEDRLDISTFATSIAELSEWKAKEQEEITGDTLPASSRPCRPDAIPLCRCYASGRADRAAAPCADTRFLFRAARFAAQRVHDWQNSA